MSSCNIAVIGAGPAGLSAAHYLQEQGHRITVFEKDSDGSGKVKTVLEKSYPYEVGAYVITRLSNALERLLNANEIELNIAPQRSMLVQTVNGWHNQHFLDYVKGNHSKTQIICALLKLLRLYRRFIVNPNDPIFYQSSLANFAKQYHLLPILDLIATSFTGLGYGLHNTATTLYFFRFLSASQILKVLILTSLKISPQWPKVVSGGLQTLFMRTSEELNICYNAKIHHIHRQANQVIIDYDQQQARFDYAFVTCASPQLLNLIDLTTKEQKIFSQVEYNHYYSTLFYAENLVKTPKRQNYYLPQHMNSNHLGDSVLITKQQARYNIFSAYQYGNDNLSHGDIEEKLLKNLNSLGANSIDIIGQYSWPNYCPHFSLKALQQGISQAADEIQCASEIIYIGSLFSFEVINSSVAHSKKTVEHFCNEILGTANQKNS